MKIGFIGLGRMGRAIVGRILGAGHDVVVYNRSPEKTADAAKAGAAVAPTVEEACRGREAVITMLADDPALREVALGRGGVRDSLPRGAAHIAMGTHGTGVIEALQGEHDAAAQLFVCAPVLGRPDAAAAGQLGIILAGAPAAAALCRPLLEGIGRRIFEAGPDPQAAAVVKLANGLVLGCAIEAMGEAFSLVRKYGAPPDVLYDVMTEGLFAAPAYKGYGRMIADGAYDQVGFTALLGLKDANLVAEAANSARVPLPSFNCLRDRLLSVIAQGHGERDWAVVADEQARASGLD